MVALYPPLGDGGNSKALIFLLLFLSRKKSKQTITGSNVSGANHNPIFFIKK